MKVAKEQIDQELGRVSGLFMSQGNIRAGDIIMPTKELQKSSKRIMDILQAQREEIMEKEEIILEENYIKILGYVPNFKTKEQYETYILARKEDLGYIKFLIKEAKKKLKNL